MNIIKDVFILVPSWSGGIDRLFENLTRSGQANDSEFQITIFKTHGRNLRGISVLPFGFVYYSSAIFYMLFRLPIRLLKFVFCCLFKKVDICHINLSTGASTFRKLLFSYVCRMFSVRYIIHLHGGRYPEFFARLPTPYRRLVQVFYAKAAHVIVLGSLWKDFVTQEIGVNPDRVGVLPNAVVGPDQFSWADKLNPPQILFLGRLIETKGIIELIDALSEERMRSLPWTAVLAGDGEVAKYRARIEDLGMSEKIQLPGWLSPDAVQDALRKSSIFVLPSHFENLPLSLLEAMAYGLCVVVTPVGSIEEVISDGKNGVIVPVGNSVSLTDTLVSLLQDEEGRQQFGENARTDFLTQYDFKNYQSKLQQIYKSALSSGG